MTKLNRRQFLAGAGAAGAAGAVATVPALAQSASASSSKAATIIRNARVFVGDDANTMASAVAIDADGRILAVGSNRQVSEYSG
ncbi:MAG: twin-arginine translocation signal domain-containing protein, partial [Actinomycetes bacterium]